MPFSHHVPHSSNVRHLAMRRRLPWALLSLVLVALVSAMTLNPSFPKLARLMQDTAANLRPATPSPDIVIVTIDAKSAQELGRWPWRRSVHAQLLQRIAAGQPKCVGVDIFLTSTDPEYPQDDAQLASALKATGCTVLPMAFTSARRGAQQSEVLPAPIFAHAATAIGHANMSIESDGTVNGFYLQEGFADRLWPHFVLAMQQAANGTRSAPDGPATFRRPSRSALPSAANARGRRFCCRTSPHPAFRWCPMSTCCAARYRLMSSAIAWCWSARPPVH